MITLASDFLTQLTAAQNKPVEVVEILFPGGGTSYFSDQAITWNGNTYLSYVVSRSDIKRYMSGQFDQVSVTFSNVGTTMAQFIANNDVQGAQLTIRLIFPTITDDSLPLFVGLIQRPGAVDEKQCVLMALERLGSMQMDAPTRLFGVQCPWLFKEANTCKYTGSAVTCDKSWANCNTLGNTDRYGGFRFLPNSGTTQYAQVSTSRFLLFFSRKTTTNVTVAFNAVDDTPYDVPIPMVLGRAQIQGIPIEHEDTGAQTNSSIAFSVGRVDDYLWLLADNQLVNIARDATLHFGDEGGTGTQLADPRFPGSYPYTLLAYMGITLASDVATTDSAPAVVAVLRGVRVDYYDVTGAWQGLEWTDNPIWNTRKFLAMSYYEGGMGIPDGWLDDVRNYAESQYCDELVADFTNDQKIYLPNPLPTGMVVGANYRLYRSTCVDGYDGTTDGPYSTFVPGVDDDTTQSPYIINVKRFTTNVAIAQQDAAIDILQSKLLPGFRGYTKQNKLGQIQICVEKPAPNTVITFANAPAGVLSITCNDSSQFNPGDQLILGTYTVNAEIATVSATPFGSVSLTAPTTKSHAIGDELLKVARAFNDSNIVDKTVIQYPLSDRQTEVNQVSVQYCDAPSGFQPRTLNCNDYANQDQVHAVNNQVLDGSGIDSYFQAWRIGQWALGLQRDLGKFVSLRTGIRSSDLEVGDDIIAVSAQEHGLVCVPFRIIEMGFTAGNEVDLVGQLYSTQIYNDEAPQSTRTVPTVFSPITNVPAGPLPYRPTLPWLPTDALYPGLATFGLFTAPGGQLAIYDFPTVNVLSAVTFAPIVPPQAVVTGGGTVPAGNALLAVVGMDAAGRRSDRSHYITANVTSGSSTLTVPGVTFDANAVSWELYYGPDSQHMWLVASDAVANPVTVGVSWVPSGIGPPDTATYRYRVIITPIRHGGIWGSAASAVAANAITVPQVASVNQWGGRVLTLYASSKVILSLGIGAGTFDGMSSARPANFNVTGNGTGGLCTVTQSTLLGGFAITQPGDVYVMCAQANIAGTNTIGDTGFVNSFAPGGLATDAEIGKIVWIKSGKGAGQRRASSGNNSTTLTIYPDWDIVPDATSRFVVLEPAGQTVECAPFTSDGTAVSAQSLATMNALYTSQGTASFLVQIVTEDADGNLSDLADAPWREVYIDPQTDIVETTVSTTPFSLQASNIVMKAAAGAAVVNLPASTSVHRQPVWAVNTSGVSLTLNAAAGETIETHSSLTIPVGMRYQLMPGADWTIVATSAGAGATGLVTVTSVGDGLLIALGVLQAAVSSGIGIDGLGNIVLKNGSGIAFDGSGNATVNAGVGLTIDGGGFLTVATSTGLAINGGGQVYIPGGAITNALLAALSVGSAQFQIGSVTNAAIAAAAIATANIQSGAVTSTQIAAATITTANIAAAAITTALIANAAITTALIGAAQITTALIANAAITNALLGTAVVGTANIQSAAITNALIANLAVGNAQINDVNASKITAGTISASVSMTSPTITSTSGTDVITLSAGNITSSDTSTGQLLTMNAGGMTITGSGINCFFSPGGFQASTVGGPTPEMECTVFGITYSPVSGTSLILSSGSLALTNMPVLVGATTVIDASANLNGVNLTVTGLIKFGGTNSTGSGAASLGSNCPAGGSLTAPNTWLEVKNAAGTAGWVPMWV